MFWNRLEAFKLIPVLPKNYRSICLHAIEVASDPGVLMNKQVITDFSEQGQLTQKSIRDCIDFEVREGDVGILGFMITPTKCGLMKIIRALQDIANNRAGSVLRGQPLNLNANS